MMMMMMMLMVNDIRDFKIQRRGRQRERQKHKRFNKQNNNFARASRYIYFLFLHDFDVKMPYFAF